MDINIEFARKTSLAYNRTCKSLCQELKLPQTAFDILMFLANNPNSALHGILSKSVN